MTNKKVNYLKIEDSIDDILKKISDKQDEVIRIAKEILDEEKKANEHTRKHELFMKSLENTPTT